MLVFGSRRHCQHTYQLGILVVSSRVRLTCNASCIACVGSGTFMVPRKYMHMRAAQGSCECTVRVEKCANIYNPSSFHERESGLNIYCERSESILATDKAPRNLRLTICLQITQTPCIHSLLHNYTMHYTLSGRTKGVNLWLLSTTPKFSAT